MVQIGHRLHEEGQVSHTVFTTLIPDGEVLVQNEVASADDGMVKSFMGRDHIGELGVVGGAPCSATCRATTDLAVAILSRDALHKIITDDAPVAALLMLAISKRLFGRLRDANRKIKSLGGLSRAMQKDLDVTHKKRPSV